MDPLVVPPARDRAAITYASRAPSGPVVDQIVMHGGQQWGQPGHPYMLADMYRWNGSDWVAITNSGPVAAPALHSHSMVQRRLATGKLTLIVVGGYVDTNDTANEDIWQFTFADENTGKWEKIGTLAGLGCTSGDHYPGSRMAIDHSPDQNKLVFFGGHKERYSGQAVSHLNLCD